MKILLMIRSSHIEFIIGFIKKLSEKPVIYIEGTINKYVKEYIKENNVKILDRIDNKINIFNLIFTFTYNFFTILQKINYNGQIISYAHGISLKPYFPSKLANDRQIFLCSFADFQTRFFKENGVKRVELFPYLKYLTIEKVNEIEELKKDIILEDCILWAPTLINKFSNSSVNKIDEKIFELSKYKKIFILLHPQTEMKDINYYIRNDNIYLINRCYYSNKEFIIKNCINICKLSTSMDILNYFKYIICDQSTIFYEGLYLNKIIFRTDLINFNKIKLDEFEKYNTTICPYSQNRMENEYNNENIILEELIKEIINKILKNNNNKKKNNIIFINKLKR
jgi:hypothetical protein